MKEKEQKEDVKTKKILIAVPTSKFIENQTVQSIYDMKKPENCEVKLAIVQGYSVHQARNIIVQQAIDGGFDYIFWVDADVILPQDILEGLLKDDKDIICGYYLKKIENQRICELFGVNPADTEGKSLSNILEQDLPPTSGIYGIKACGFGCTLTKIDVFKKLSEEHPDDLWFDYIFKKNEMCSEDILFCKRAEEEGFPTFVDTKYKCGHVGNKIF
jgi:hypothetical protein